MDYSVAELLFFFACIFAIISLLQSLIIKIFSTKKIKLTYFSSFLSHIGVAIFLTGAVLYGILKKDEQIVLEKGILFESNNGFQCMISKIDIEVGRKYSYIIPNIDLEYKKNYFTLKPKIIFTKIINENKEFFDVSMFPDIKSIGLTNIYIEPQNVTTNSEAISLLLSIKPYINLVWIGFITLLIGLLLSVIGSVIKK